MKKQATLERFQRMAPACQDILDAFIEREQEVECPHCRETFQTKLPDALSLKAALGALDRGGFGPTQKHIHRQEALPETPAESLQGLIGDLLPLPYRDRLSIAQGLLPEHAPVSPSRQQLHSGSHGESQVVDSS